MQIKIIKASNPQCWYADKIGQIFNTVDGWFMYAGFPRYLIDNNQWSYFVEKDDAEEIKIIIKYY